MHFTDDHHSGTIGHGKETHDKRDDTGDHAAHQELDSLDTRLRTDSQGGITVQIQFREVTEKGELAFAVKMNDHVIGINQYALDNLAFLANDLGTQIQAIRWQSITLSAQHVAGTLYFPGKDDAGRPLLGQGARSVILQIKGLAGIPERVFQWSIISGGQSRRDQDDRYAGLWPNS